jgi:hypothetical protein
MRYLLVVSFLLAVLTGLAGQSLQHLVTPLTSEAPCPGGCLFEGQVPFARQEPFYSYYLTWADGPLDARIRFSTDGRDWTPWQALERYDRHPEKRISQLYFGDADHAFYQLRVFTPAADEGGYTLHWAHPGLSPATAPPSSPSLTPLDGPCAMPAFKDRAGWCPTGDCTEHPNPVSTTVGFLIIHHSAGANTASDWDAQVRLIWDFHVNGNGWSDIGYNWLIAPTGQLYQGRGDDITGAHFCGNNSNTMGVCMLGNYMTTTPTPAALTTLESLLAWKAADSDIDVLSSGYHASSGFVLPHMAGHRDGCATLCPGDLLYPLLPALREGVANRIVSGCPALASPLVLSWEPLDEMSYALNWLYNEDATATGFSLERSPDGTDYSLVADLAAEARSYTETDFSPGDQYYYRIRAYNDSLQSGYSNTVMVNTLAVGTRTARLPEHTLALAPNPANEIVHLQWQLSDPAPVQLILRNEQLQVLRVWQQEGQPPAAIRLTGLPAGRYFLQVVQGQRQHTWPLVKQ